MSFAKWGVSLDYTFKQPELGDPLSPAQPGREILDFLRLRRSTPIDLMEGPGPDEDALKAILTVAARVPDHRKMVPWRFIVFKGEARTRMGSLMRERFHELEPEASEKQLDCEARRFERAPVVVAVVSRVDLNHKTPEWEQILSAGAVCQNLLLAARATGFSASWLSEWHCYDQTVTSAMGLQENERVAGFIYLGTARENPRERPRPVLEDIVTYY